MYPPRAWRASMWVSRTWYAEEGLAEGSRARHMCGHACSAPVGERSRPSKPPCPSQHTHVAVLVTLRLTIVDFLFLIYVIYSVNRFLYLFHDKPGFTEHNFDYVWHFLFRVWFSMVSGNLGFPSETSVKNPVNSLFFAFFLHKRFVKLKAVNVV